MKITDEILNRYIDGELTCQELKDFLIEVDSSVQIKEQLNILQTASNSFKKINEYSPSDDFTSRLMLQLNKKLKPRTSDKIFIFSISSIFIVLSLTIIGFILAQIIGTNKPAQSLVIGENIIGVLGTIAQPFVSLFSSSSISLVGAIISFGIIISGYFYFDYQKTTR
ncbi:MAG: hypothetical protein K8H86_09685 [Ignavibacteriaceae bacterium]|nr:hypothetical protein [Ignavibacteriaceae bacterium]